MTARALRFEDRERKTIALYALEFYKVGTIVFIHELNGTLSEKRWNPDIRRSKPLGTTGEFHSYPGNTKAASPNMPAICSMAYHRRLAGGPVTLYRACYFFVRGVRFLTAARQGSLTSCRPYCFSGAPSSPCWGTPHPVPGMLLFCAGS